jgi:hypothetical protein
MKKGVILLVIVSTLAFLWPVSTASADELSELKQQVETQNKTLSQLQRRIDGLEAGGTQGAGLPGWIQNIKMSGDFRYRHEHLDEELTNGNWDDGVDRHRIRMRLMLQAIINDEWDVAFRIASGSDKSPISTNQDLEDAFSKKDVWLDLAYFTWHPAAHEGLKVFGGKMKNVFYKAGKNQLIFDGDLNPEGIAAQHVKPLSEACQLFLTGGGFWVDENGGGVDTSLWGAQAYVKHTIASPEYVIAGASFYDYGNIDGRGSLGDTWGPVNFFANTNSGGVYSSDYDIFEAFGEYGFECYGRPLAVFASCVQNVVASTNDDTGWLIGGKLNKAKDPGSWELSYDYRDLEADAVVGGFTESDFLGSRTDSKGHKFGYKYQIAKNLQAGLTYYHLEDISNSSIDRDYRRLQTDLIFKF